MNIHKAQTLLHTIVWCQKHYIIFQEQYDDSSFDAFGLYSPIHCACASQLKGTCLSFTWRKICTFRHRIHYFVVRTVLYFYFALSFFERCISEVCFHVVHDPSEIVCFPDVPSKFPALNYPTCPALIPAAIIQHKCHEFFLLVVRTVLHVPTFSAYLFRLGVTFPWLCLNFFS